MFLVGGACGASQGVAPEERTRVVSIDRKERHVSNSGAKDGGRDDVDDGGSGSNGYDGGVPVEAKRTIVLEDIIYAWERAK
ncbi:hypothetical protein HZH66_004471 [Vespula vulgaris]|uniref:Uncharacterized protein n=1 Tax=Vespula vulgaris TaxID=7454 RepID=A0A834KFA4_VESVU|nr:hypothetical protein HZH66_004471 [Vespula vulgaris]